MANKAVVDSSAQAPIEPEVETVAPAEPVRSRRSIIAAGIGGLAGLVLGSLGHPSQARASAGNPLLLGSTSNNAGSSDTSLTTASAGTALLVTQTGAGTALRGSATAPETGLTAPPFSATLHPTAARRSASRETPAARWGSASRAFPRLPPEPPTA